MKKTARNIYLGFILFLMYAPIATLVVLSLTHPNPVQNGVDLRSNGTLPCFRTTPL